MWEEDLQKSQWYKGKLSKYFEEIWIFSGQLIVYSYEPQSETYYTADGMIFCRCITSTFGFFSCFENKIIHVHSCAVSDWNPWGWIRLVLICWLAFCFGWVVSLFIQHQVRHLPELCELIQHPNLRVQGKARIRCTALVEVTWVIWAVIVTLLSKEKAKLCSWEWRPQQEWEMLLQRSVDYLNDPGRPCPRDAILFGRDCWTSICQYPLQLSS